MSGEPEFEPGHGYTQEDWDEVSDNPELTEEDFARAKPGHEAFTAEMLEALNLEGYPATPHTQPRVLT